MEQEYKARRIMERMSIVAALLVCLSLITQFILLFVAGLVLIAVAIAILHRWWRCPDCGAFLGVSKTDKCPNCKRPIE